MSDRTAQHDTFVLERTYDASPARVFRAFADPEAKAKWFGGPADRWTPLHRQADFRVGGREQTKGSFAGGAVSTFDSQYYDIVPDRRIVYAYEMRLDDVRISVSLATVEFKPSGTGTTLVVTEQGVFLDGYDDVGKREQGTRGLLANLDRVLREEEVTVG